MPSELVKQGGALVRSESAELMSALTAMASNPNFDADKVAKLMEVGRQMRKDEAEAEFNRELSDLQQCLPRIRKDGRVFYQARDAGKPPTDFHFATYDNIDKAIRPLLAQRGFSLSFDMEPTDKGDVYIGTLHHRLGHSKSSRLRLPADTSGGKNAIQAVGSTDSYARRYLVTRLLNIVTEGQDDDGNAISVITEEQVMALETMVADAKLSDKEKAGFFDLIGFRSIAEITKAAYPIAFRALSAKVKARQK